MAVIPYLPNIPQATDQLSISQGNILGNFQGIQQLVDVNHEDFASGNAGKHKQVTLTDQSANLPVVVAGTDIVMYSATEIAPFSAIGQQIYLKYPSGIRVPTTATGSTGNSGWTYLPSGIKMAWAQLSIAISPGLNTIALNAALFGANFIAFTTLYNMQLTGGLPNGNVVSINTLSAASLTYYSSGATAGGLVYIFAVGV